MNELTINQNWFPLYGNLLEASNDILFHEKHNRKLAHPADILNEKLMEVKNRLAKLIELASENNTINEEKEIIVKNYISELDNFYDAIFLIIKCLTPPNNDRNDVDVIKWLNTSKSIPTQQFCGNTKAHHEKFRIISNKIKHDHIRVGFNEIEDYNGTLIKGFFIKGIINANDQRGPDPEIHKPYKGCSTSFSYNYFIPYSIGCLVTYLFNLNKVLFTQNAKTKHQNNVLYEIILACKMLDRSLFPNEYSEPFVKIKINTDQSLLFRFPFRQKNLNYDKIVSASCDGELNPRTKIANGVIPYFPLLKNRII